MICPNDGAQMHQVKIMANYGLPLFLDQCEKCGGIWFDESELYRAKLGEAEKIDSLNADILIAATPVDNSVHKCPKDAANLSRFADKNFPSGIIVERCPICNGFWLNRGGFTQYQNFRQEFLRSKAAHSEDKKLQKEVEAVLVTHENQDSDDVLTRLGKFLSKPVDAGMLLNAESNQKSSDTANTIGTVLNVLTTLLRLFVFR